jgi:hypothetical protein
MWRTLGVTGAAVLFLAGVWQWSKPAVTGDPESSPGS